MFLTISLGEFMMSEMLFLSKSLEIYTRAYQELMAVDEDEDIEQLQESMKLASHEYHGTQQDPIRQSMYTSAPSIMQNNPARSFDRTL